MIDSGVIKKDGAGSKAALVYGQMNEPPGARARVALTGLTVAEYFRDQEGQDVLFFVDNILDLHKQVQRFLHYWEEFHQQWVISLHLQLTWVIFKKELRLLTRVLLHLYRRFMYQQMT